MARVSAGMFVHFYTEKTTNDFPPLVSSQRGAEEDAGSVEWGGHGKMAEAEVNRQQNR